MRSVRIPADRVGTIIGTKGETKRVLMRTAGITIEVDTEGEVLIHDDKAKDPLKALQLMDVIRAIGRGFSPERAMRLFQDDEYFEIIDLKEFVSGRNNQLSRIRGRVIGQGGKTRAIIEDLTGISMSIYGNTIALIGSSAGLPVAKHAIELLLNGSEHSTVYRYLEGQRPMLRIAEMGFDI
ncbi:MAG: KH domain-containing protein [Methanomassiliicoccaceae archaeon]|jgi:ribosomal RNA assembly protein|nr:KH domain-containing protein [Methanomassiliicoccaceae archaeon]